ncbi:MAG: chromosome segregation protein SMC [Phycisphaera sp.]|nr:chromosome segregation protein SMC [Phycisphaera sp.]
MRLAKLTLAGFKSFADRTEIPFDCPITGIVGPNGCGKSNVVDAIKWVLGELSAKSLRGSGMLDMIFNGSSSRKPAGMASVTLTFDNPRNPDGGRTLPLDFDTVTVTRQLYRDGSSDYLINNHRARLRDIRELFLDTGIGTDAYSIIEQGKVAQLLESNPVERREIFEEAAGISRFKARKKESLRKLEKTQQNLVVSRQRMDDLERRLRSVKLQAGKARSYKEYSSLLAQLRLTHALAQYHKHQTQLADLSQQLEQAEADRAHAQRHLSEHEQNLADAQLERQSIAQQQKQAEHARLQHQSAREQADQRRQFAQSSLADLERQTQRDEERLDDLEVRAAQLTRELDEQNKLVEELATRQREAEHKLADAQKLYTQRQHELNNQRSKLDDEKAGIVSLMRRTAQLHNEINSIDAFEKSLVTTREKLETRAGEVATELERLLTSRDELSTKHDEARQLITEQSQRLDEQKSQAASLDTQVRDLADRLAKLKDQRTSLNSRRALLQEMQDKQAGVSDPVKAVLARKASAITSGKPDGGTFGFVRGLLAEMLETDVEHAPIVETALGDHQQSLVVDRADVLTSDSGKEALGVLGGRVTFLPIDTAGSPIFADLDIPEGASRLLDHVKFDPALSPLAHRLLGRTLVARDLSHAYQLRTQLPGGFRFVTRTGELLETDGRVVAGPIGTAQSVGGLIARRSELSRLQRQLAELDTRINQDSQELSSLSDRASHIELLCQELRNGIYEANTVRVELHSRLENLGSQIARLEREQPVIAAETEQVHRQLHDASQKRSAHTGEAQKLEADSHARQAAVDEIEKSIALLSTQVEESRDTATSLRVEAGKLAEQHTAAQRQVRQAQIASDDVKRQHKLIADQLDAHRQRHAELDEMTTKAKQQALQAQAQLDQADARLEEIQSRLTEADESVTALHDQLDTHRKALEAADALLHEKQMAKREVEVLRDSLRQRAHEELSLDVEAAYAAAMNPTPQSDGEVAPTQAGDEQTPAPESPEAPPEAASNPPALHFDPKTYDASAVESQIAELKQKIDRLGNVNVDAIDEQQQVEADLKAIADQVIDIEEAGRQLEALIKQINEDSRTRFEQVFNQIKENFGGSNGLFRRLFGGGKADILLQPDENGNVDVLESGIEIVARPPGKELQSIRLMSGGEKAMTAVALLLSIFQSKPSPFAILDEVDAPLDEANVQRYANILKSFLDHSHFIVITHNKGTMQACDVLYGITMQERGVSKRVAVRFDQVGSDGKLDPTAVADQSKRDELNATQPTPAPADVAPPPASNQVLHAGDQQDIKQPNDISHDTSHDNDNGRSNGKSRKKSTPPKPTLQSDPAAQPTQHSPEPTADSSTPRSPNDPGSRMKKRLAELLMGKPPVDASPIQPTQLQPPPPDNQSTPTPTPEPEPQSVK